MHRQLMVLYVGAGNRSAALRQYQICRRILAQELDVEPGAETTALYEQIWRGKERPPARAPARPQPRGWGEAPVLPTFYGRRAELAHLSQWLVGDGCRLAAILGMGGIGKTALAARITQEVAG